VRVPFIARHPGFIPANQVCSAFATSLDVLPTMADVAGAMLPANPLDGVDIRGLLTGAQASVSRDAFLYFNDVYLQAARFGPWKLHLSRFNVPAFCPAPAEGRLNLPLPWPELYDVVADADEGHDRFNRNGAIVHDIRSRAEAILQTFPADIQDAWSRTLAMRVQGTPAGCFPIRQS
jgi:arylsulfatase